VRSSNDESEIVEVAAGYVTGTAEKWFIGKYATGTLPTFKDFIAAFKARFTRGDDERQLRIQIETITQGNRSPLDYAADFEMILTEIGVGKYDEVWAKHHFERGLDNRIQYQVGPQFTAADTIDDMATRAQRSY
jgi:Ty3 transposon capsid-like protein